MEEDHSTFLLDCSYLCRGKSTEELTESLLITTMEVESARFKAQEELKVKDHEIFQLKQLLNAVIEEKNEAENRYRRLLQYHRSHRQTTTPPPVSSVEDEPITNGGFSSSDCEESIVSSPVNEPPVRFIPSPEEEFGFPVKALPEKGKLLEAVIKAGPLLQNLLLAGPLPQWRHPPPPMETYQVPPPFPVALPTPPAVHRLIGKFEKKRGFGEGSDSCMEAKYQRIRIN